MDSRGIRVEDGSRLDKCPACGHENFESGSSAIVSPWVLELAGIKDIYGTQYKICSHCESSWFNRGYSTGILNSLYRAYRGEEYFRIRNSWEPTYTNQLNSALNSGVGWLQGRRTQITDSLERAGLKTKDMNSVLDFGGGHGGVMPKLPNRFLFEENESVIPEPGVKLIQKWEEARKLSLDLVMCCGVLEHLNEPSVIIKKVLELESNTYLFEVPTGIPVHRRGPASSEAFLKFLASNKFLWRGVQSLERRLSRKWREFFPLRCSEHLQFFSAEGLTKLLENCGLEVIEISETKPNNLLTDKQNLGFEVGLIAVCRKC